MLTLWTKYPGMTATLVSVLEREIAKFTYRPGWTFSVIHDQFLGPTLRIIAPVQDGYDPSRTIDLGINSRIPPNVLEDPRQLGTWLLWRLTEVEIHECREMLRYDGKLVSDPHQGLPADSPGMVRVNTRWVQELEQFGNEPGLNQGDVVIELDKPVDGMQSITVASDKVSFGAEAGSVVGIVVELDDGRHMFVPWANVTGFIDAPAAGKKRKA